MTEREAMKQALEALETAWYHVGTFAPTDDAIELYDQARTSLRQAIEQAEKREPVATVVSENKPVTMSWWHEPALPVGTKLYTTPQPQREWVGLTDKEMLECNMDGDFMIDRETAKRNVEAKLKEKNT